MVEFIDWYCPFLKKKGKNFKCRDFEPAWFERESLGKVQFNSNSIFFMDNTVIYKKKIIILMEYLKKQLTIYL